MITFGKYKGKRLQDMTSRQETNYLHWLYNSKYCSVKLKREIKIHFNI